MVTPVRTQRRCRAATPLTFGKQTADALSPMNDRWLPPVERLRVSVLLGLVSMEEIVAPVLAAMK